MANPKNRKEFKEFCLRALGAPVIQINVDDDQVEDRIDTALQYWHDYHFDGSEKVYYKFMVTDQNVPGVISEINIVDGGEDYEVGDELIFTDVSGSGANVTVSSVDSNGAITAFDFNDRGNGYLNEPQATITSDNGTGAVLQAFNGGYIPMPDNIMGAVNIFDIGDALMTNNMFNIRYQIILNDLYSLTSMSMVPYFMTMQHLQFLEYLLVGKQPIRYNRHKNKLYIDMDWARFINGGCLVVEAYQVINPDTYTKSWNDRWLKRYATALIKQQWGNNLKKYIGVQMPGGRMFNGQQIYDEATMEIEKLEAEMLSSYSLPVTDMIG